MEIILKMIEEVDPNDTAKLDEIDGYVFMFINEIKERNGIYNSGGNWIVLDGSVWYELGENGEKHKCSFDEYTRSRDALKAIRPEGWFVHSFYEGVNDKDNDKIIFFFQMGKTNENYTYKVALPTEELAELHAIIQAIAYERNK